MMLFSGAALAADPVISGYDVVAYFGLNATDDGVQGLASFAHNFTSPDKDGSPRFTYEFWFANAANRDKFAADPWKYMQRDSNSRPHESAGSLFASRCRYAPKYGGF